MYEKEIKKEVVNRLTTKFNNSFVVPERCLCNERGSFKSRIDVFLIHELKFVGYEIKGSKDNPKRLVDQISRYQFYFDKLIIVTEPKHSKVVQSIIPDFCGLIEVFKAGDTWEFITVKKALENSKVDLKLLLGILWKTEIYSLLREKGFKNIDSLSKNRLKTLLLKNSSDTELRTAINNNLKLRPIIRN